MPKIGPLELIVILVIVLVIFGAGRLVDIGGALGKGMRAFKRGVTGEEDSDQNGKASEAAKAKEKGKT